MSGPHDPLSHACIGVHRMIVAALPQTQLIHSEPDEALFAELCDYLRTAPAGSGVTPEHDPRWLSILHESMGHQPLTLLTRDPVNDNITGYLPLAMVRSRLFGRFLVSLPYLNHAGVVASDQASADALIERAATLARELDADYLELRHLTPHTHASLPQVRDDKCRMTRALPQNAEQLWSSIDTKVRNQVRKFQRANLSCKWGGLDLLDDFYAVFSQNMRDLGTPVYPRSLFASILDRMPDAAEIAVISDENARPAAAALLIHTPSRAAHAATTLVPSASCLRSFNDRCANMGMYHHLLLRAIDRGSTTFDFGRSSKDSGTWRFKKQWGAEPEQVTWQYLRRKGDPLAARPDNPRYARRIALWRKLPVWATNLIGPAIVRGIP
jgi:serine/alanine adding enzyme